MLSWGLRPISTEGNDPTFPTAPTSIPHVGTQGFGFGRTAPERRLQESRRIPRQSGVYGGPDSPGFGRGAGQVFAAVNAGGGVPAQGGEEQQPKQYPYTHKICCTSFCPLWADLPLAGLEPAIVQGLSLLLCQLSYSGMGGRRFPASLKKEGEERGEWPPCTPIVS